MALLGQSINPALFVQDYSGFAKAGAIQAQGMQNLGQQIQGIANDYATNKKEESKLSAAKKAGIADIQAAIQLSKSSGLGMESTLEPLLAAATDPNSSLMEQAAAAQQASQTIGTTMNAKFKIEELNMQRQAASRAGAMDAAKLQAIAGEKAQEDALANTIGKELFKSTVARLPKDLSVSLLAASKDLTPAQQYKIATSREITSLITEPKNFSDPTIVKVDTPKGTQQKVFNPTTGTLDPLSTIVSQPIGTQIAQDIIGFTPSEKPVTEVEKLQVQKLQQEQQDIVRQKEDAASAAKRTLNSISTFLKTDPKTNSLVPTGKLKNTVGFGESANTFISQYAPFLGTQSPQERASQKELSLLLESDILKAASALKPVSNTDLQMLIRNRPGITDPPELWVETLKNIQAILRNKDNYISSSTTSGNDKPISAADRLRNLQRPQ